MEILSGTWKALNWCIGLKAETDYWNSHSEDYKSAIWMQTWFGIVLGAVAWYLYSRNPMGSLNSTLPVLIFFEFLSVCWVMNSWRNLQEKEFMSQNFSEFWLFGFCKGDDYMSGIIVGSICVLAITWSIFSVTVLHNPMSISLKIGSMPLAPQAVPAKYASPMQAPTHHVATVHHATKSSKHHKHAARHSTAVHHGAPSHHPIQQET